jgi:hypothetical protein
VELPSNGGDKMECWQWRPYLCSFADSTKANSLGLLQCYEDIVKPLCENVATGTNTPADVGTYKYNTNINHVVGGLIGCSDHTPP